MKINLKFKAMSILMAGLQETQMWAVYQMGMGNEMPLSVTKDDLTCIIAFLFKQLQCMGDFTEFLLKIFLSIKNQLSIFTYLLTISSLILFKYLFFFYSMKSSIILLAVLGTALAEVFLEERFTDGK